MADAVVQLRCGVKASIFCSHILSQFRSNLVEQNDGWGKKGKESLVAQLWSQTPNNGPIDDSEHYSEVSFSESLDYKHSHVDLRADVDGHVPFKPISLTFHGRTPRGLSEEAP